jgi:hypothetical protein
LSSVAAAYGGCGFRSSVTVTIIGTVDEDARCAVAPPISLHAAGSGRGSLKRRPHGAPSPGHARVNRLGEGDVVAIGGCGCNRGR